MKISRSSLIRGAVALATASLLSACGGDSVSPSGTLSVTPAKGAVYGAPVAVYDAQGRQVGSGTTSATTGDVSVDLYSTGAAPYTVQVRLVPGVKMWDESANNGSGAEITLDTDQGSMLAIALQVSEPIGVTPLTSVAAAIAGVTDPTKPPATFTPDSVVTAVAKTNALFGLPATFNINTPPVPATAANPTPTDTYGAVLKEMAVNAGEGGALTQLSDLISAGTDVAAGNLSSTTTTLAAVVNAAASEASVEVSEPPADLTSLNEAAAALEEAIKEELEGNEPTGTTGPTGPTGLNTN